MRAWQLQDAKACFSEMVKEASLHGPLYELFIRYKCYFRTCATQTREKVVAWFDCIPNQALNISVLTLGEIRKEVEKISDSLRKEKLRLWLEIELPAWFENRILAIEQSVADRWGRLQANVKRPLTRYR